MACLEGGPWIPLESQHDTLNNASWTTGGRWSQTEGGREKQMGSDKMRERKKAGNGRNVSANHMDISADRTTK